MLSIQYPDRVVVCLDLPGIDESSLDIIAHSACVFVSCIYRQTYGQGGRILFSGRRSDPISFSIPVGFGLRNHIQYKSDLVNRDTIAADYNHGLLLLTFSKEFTDGTVSDIDRLVNSVNAAKGEITLSRPKRKQVFNVF